MFNINSLYTAKIFLELNLLILILILVVSIIINSFHNEFYKHTIFNNKSINLFLKFIIICSFIFCFYLFVISLFIYCKYSYNYSLFVFSSYLYNFNSIELYNYTFFLKILPSFFKMQLTIDLFGLVLLLLAYIVGFLSILTLDTRFFWKNNKYLYYFNIFLIIVYLYVTVSNILIFFFLYELLLIPSFLIIYFLSTSRRSMQASIYFVIWTQLGSLLVLIALAYIINLTNLYNFSDLVFFKFTHNEGLLLIILLFFGFGFKIPIWPFHYWLTKTHVEAPSGFSIYLSGFLVKSALYGFYKLTTNLYIEVNTSFFIAICIIGVVDSSLKMWGQTDLKKLVAYGTIQEMNLIFLTFCWGDSYMIIAGIIFTTTHAFLSTLMFFIVDCVYRRFHSRSIIEINGILHILPNLSILIIAMIVFFSGLPGTIKFISEFFIFSSFFEISPIICFLLMFVANTIGLVGFSKVWLNLLFGLPKKNSNLLIIDLALKEIYIITICLLFLIILSYFNIFLF